MAPERKQQPKIDPANLIDWSLIHLPTKPEPEKPYGFEFHLPGAATNYCVEVYFNGADDPKNPDNYTIGGIEHWYTDNESTPVANELVEQLLNRRGLTLQQLFATVLERTHLHEL